MKNIYSILALLFVFTTGFSQVKEIIPIEQKAFQSEKVMHPKNPLLDNYDVCFYFIDINATNQNKTISGKGSVKAKVVNQPLSELMLQLISSLTVDSVLVDGQNFAFTHTNNEIHIILPTPNNVDQYFTVDVYYHGTSSGTEYQKRSISQLGIKNNMDT